MQFKIIYNYLSKIVLMCLFTYSSNIILLTQKFYNEKIFVDAALLFSVLMLIYTALGGSIRMLSANKVDKNLIVSTFAFRIYLGILIAILIFILKFPIIIFLILMRKTVEWIIDPLITFTIYKNSIVNFFIILLDFTFLLLILLNYENFILYVIWILLPIIYSIIIYSSLKIKNFVHLKVSFQKLFLSSNYLVVIGFEGPAGIVAILFRFLVKNYNNQFLIDALFYTIILSGIVNFLIKILIPVFKQINVPNLIRNKQMEMFLYLQIILLVMLLPFTYVLSNYVIIYVFTIFFFLQTISLLFRKILINNNRLKEVFKREIFIGVLITLILFLCVLTEKTILLGWFYAMNALLNWFFYKDMKIKFNKNIYS